MSKVLNAFHFVHKNKIYLLVPAIIILIFFISIRDNKLVIYPGISTDKIIAFDDHEGNGNSRVDCFTIDTSGITLQYVLQDKILYPYTGFKLILKQDSVYKNLSGYDYFSIDLSLKDQQDLIVCIHTIIPGFTDESKVLSYRYMEKSFNCKQSKEHFTIPLKSFITPTWWYVLNKFPDDSLKTETFKNAAEIIVENGYNSPVDKSFNFTLKELSFQKSIYKRAILASAAIICWFLLYGFLYFIYKSQLDRVQKRVIISYEPLKVSNDSDDCLNRILTFIAKEYKNPELTVNQIACEVGILPARVTQILREKKNCSYKQYLNAIRLAEAKRLLLETDRNIVDISLKVGYNNVTHFNRIFKETEGVSPRQFRSSSLKI